MQDLKSTVPMEDEFSTLSASVDLIAYDGGECFPAAPTGNLRLTA